MKQSADDSLFIDTEDSLGVEPDASNDGMSVSMDVPSPAPTKSHKKVCPTYLNGWTFFIILLWLKVS